MLVLGAYMVPCAAEIRGELANSKHTGLIKN